MLAVAAGILYCSGLVRLGRWWMRRQGPRLIIVNYHAVTGGKLREHLLYLRRHYRLLHLEDALEELFTPSKRPVEDRRTLLVITLDDGCYDNYTHAFTLACELQIPLTLFLIPGYIETGERFWWQEPNYLIKHAQVQEVVIEGQTYHLNIPEERASLAQSIDTRLRFASSVDEREMYLRGVRQLLVVPHALELEERSNLPISWKEVEIMKRSEWISFGGHTMHHPVLAYLTDPNEIDYEVCESRIQLGQHLESPIRSFAYPIGMLADIGRQAVLSVQKAGYTWAVTAVNGINTPQTNQYLLHRFSVDVNHHWLTVAAKVSGVGKRVSNAAKIFTSLFKMPIRVAALSPTAAATTHDAELPPR
jgi:peptidoglycan/xylan/chitin deacetylase (PgdA/CDA1 family)